MPFSHGKWYGDWNPQAWSTDYSVDDLIYRAAVEEGLGGDAAKLPQLQRLLYDKADRLMRPGGGNAGAVVGALRSDMRQYAPSLGADSEVELGPTSLLSRTETSSPAPMSAKNQSSGLAPWDPAHPERYVKGSSQQIGDRVYAATNTDQSISDEDPYAPFLADLQKAPNPFGQDSPEFQTYLQNQASAYARGWAPQRQQLMSGLAGRGLLGSGMEAAGRTALSGAQAMGLGDLQTRLQGEQFQRGTDWDQNRRQAMLSALGGQSQRQLGFAGLAADKARMAAQQGQWGQQFGLEQQRFQLAKQQWEAENDPLNRLFSGLGAAGGYVAGRAMGGR